jgi:hypothetical protein
MSRSIVSWVRCAHCGAPLEDAGAPCRFCGARRPDGDRPDAASRAARFERAAAHPTYVEALKAAPPIERWTLGGALTIGGLLLLLGGAGLLSARVLGPHDELLGLVGASVCLGLAALLVYGMFFHGAARGPIHRELCLMVAQRAGAGNTVVRHVTVQSPDGQRRELRLEGNARHELLAAGDIGVAFVRKVYLLAFTRIDV